MPCPLEAKMQNDLLTTLRGYDAFALSAMRTFETSLQRSLIERAQKGDLTEEELHSIVSRSAKQEAD